MPPDNPPTPTPAASPGTPPPPPLPTLLQVRRAQAQAHGERESRLHRRSRLLGTLRLVLFAGILALLVHMVRGEPSLFWTGPLPAMLVFAGVVVVHRRVRAREAAARHARLLAEESAARLEGGTGPGAPARLPARPVSALDGGEAGLTDEGRMHVLAPWVLEDLGIDGPPGADGHERTLFRELNTVQSVLGARRLRRVLRTPLRDPAAIRARQEAVEELRERAALRDALLLALFDGRSTSARRIPAFLVLPRALPGGGFRVLAALTGVAGAASVGLALWQAVLWPLAAAVIGFGFVLRWRLRHRTGGLREAWLELEPVLRTALAVARTFEAQAPRSARLQQFRDRFHEHLDPRTPDRLPRLLRWIACLHLHEIGFLYGIIEFVTLWDLQWLLALEGAARAERARIERLVAAVADLEALLALATYAAEHAETHVPELLETDAPRLVLRKGEHPLLPHGRAVPNDVDLGERVRLELVIGSNMAGKSTFLRMVALNVVLAQIGSRVRAAAMQLTPLALHANINVRDSLADGKSYFFVEVERVRAILEAAQHDRFVLGIFDELFRGTNSTERLAASREIARTLAASGGLFLLATHDLELTRLVSEEQVPGMDVLHFTDRIVDGRMEFPYRAHRGIAPVHNALELLAIAGYPQELVDRARAAAARRRPE